MLLYDTTIMDAQPLHSVMNALNIILLQSTMVLHYQTTLNTHNKYITILIIHDSILCLTTKEISLDIQKLTEDTNAQIHKVKGQLDHLKRSADSEGNSIINI